MANYDREQLIMDYLHLVEQELRDLPVAERAEIIGDLRSHIEEAVGELDTATEADVRNVLERLGHPVNVAQEARSRSDGIQESPTTEDEVEPDRTPGALEVAAIILTALFWPIGVLLAWLSDRWKKRDKVIATVIPLIATLMLGAIVLGGMVAYESDTAPVSVVSESVQLEEPAAPPGSVPDAVEEIEPRSPSEISEANGSGATLSRLLVVMGFLGGVVAGPFFTAIYLAVRMQPIAKRPGARVHGGPRGIPAGGRL